VSTISVNFQATLHTKHDH